MAFDPYARWLNIPPDRRPPTYYDLLGLPRFEGDAAQIHQAAMRRMGKVRTHQLGPHSDLSQEVLAELARARLTLMDPDRKAEYDAELRRGVVPRPRRARPPALARRPRPEARPPFAPALADAEAVDFADLDFAAETEPGRGAPRRRSSVGGAGILVAIAAAIGLSAWGYPYLRRKLAEPSTASKAADPGRAIAGSHATSNGTGPAAGQPAQPIERRHAASGPAGAAIRPAPPRPQVTAPPPAPAHRPDLPANWAAGAGPRFALEFAGGPSRVQFRLPWPAAARAGTVELWFRLSQPWNGRPSVPLLSGQYLSLDLSSGLVRFSKMSAHDIPFVGAQVATIDVSWHHLAGCWNRDGIRVFWDGQMVQFPEGAGPIQAAGSQLRLGSKTFRGAVGFVRIAATDLYRHDFDPFQDPPPASPKTLLLYDFAEGQGKIVHDQSGHGHDGQVVDCQWVPLMP